MKRIIIITACTLLFALVAIYLVHIIPETVQSRMPGQQYIVSLGDSVAAGVGLGADSNRCGQTGTAYPILLGQQLHEQALQFACSGATVGQSDNTLITQYQLATPYLRDSNVVMYAGANDVGWLDAIVNCTQSKCDTTQNRSAFARKLANMKHDLTNLLGQIQQAKPSRVLVNTYYQLIANNTSCLSKLGITPQDSTFINDEETLLNSVITAAANDSKATTVNINFNGHLLCDPQPWIQGVTANAPLHPTTAGQQQIANQDAKAIVTTTSY